MPQQVVKITREKLVPLWESGVKVNEIARQLDVAATSVSGAARRFGLKMRNPKIEEDFFVEEPKPEPPKSSPLEPRPNFSNERDMALIKSEGRYQSVSWLAREWNLPMQLVTARWHQLRAALNTHRAPAIRKVKT